MMLPQGLQGLAQLNQFVLWRPTNERTNKDGLAKVDKIPFCPHTGNNIDQFDPKNWHSAQQALELVQMFPGCGVGFCVMKGNNISFIDCDESIVDGQYTAVGASLAQWFNGAFIERSYSGRGFHIIMQGVATVQKRKIKNKENNFDLYDNRRFIALTLDAISGNCMTNHQQTIDNLVYHYLRKDEDVEGSEWTTEPADDWRGPEDDDELLAKALDSKNARSVFNSGARFIDLWEANEEVLAQSYPPDDATKFPFNHSDADAGLLQMLSFWTGKNSERTDRLFRRSALYREKWERDDYRRVSMKHAQGLCKKVYKEKQKDPEKVPVEPIKEDEVAQVIGYQFLDFTGQQTHFKNCAYVVNAHKVFTPKYGLISPDRFKATYGGYVFAMDSENHKTTKNAFEVFTETQAGRFTRVEDTVFRPQYAPFTVFKEEGKKYVNSYSPIPISCIEGDVSPFFDHLNTICPDQEEANYVLYWMALTVQQPALKLQCMLTLQGAEGNGKTFLMRCLVRAIGNKYAHITKSKGLDSDFNEWAFEKVFIGFEEIYTNGKNNANLIDTLKELVTNIRIERHSKGVDQTMGDNYANIFACTNHRDAIKKTANDRRNLIIFTKQQSRADLEADGMDADYFSRLYNWAEKVGFSAVTFLLKSIEIPPEITKQFMYRAPTTKSTKEVIRAGMGAIEQEIDDRVEQETPGFCDGWISSCAFDQLLSDIKRSVSINKRREILESCGYFTHKALGKTGRCSRIIEGSRPRLYVKKDSIHNRLKTAKEVMDAYEKSQGASNSQRAHEVFGGV